MGHLDSGIGTMLLLNTVIDSFIRSWDTRKSFLVDMALKQLPLTVVQKEETVFYDDLKAFLFETIALRSTISEVQSAIGLIRGKDVGNSIYDLIQQNEYIGYVMGYLVVPSLLDDVLMDLQSRLDVVSLVDLKMDKVDNISSNGKEFKPRNKSERPYLRLVRD